MDNTTTPVVATHSEDAWQEVPVFTMEMVRTRTVKFKSLPVGPDAKTHQEKTDSIAFLHQLLDRSPTEQINLLFLNDKNQLLGAYQVSATDADTQTTMRSIFRPAVVSGAQKVILAFNHPNGNARATSREVMMTGTAIEVGQLLGIEILDAIVVSPDNTHYSFWENQERFEEEMTAILQREKKGMDAISGLLKQIGEALPGLAESGSIGNIRMDQTRGDVIKKVFPNGNPFAGVVGKVGGGSDPNKNSN